MGLVHLKGSTHTHPHSINSRFNSNTSFNFFSSLFSDVLNVSGKFNSDELSRDMSVGDDGKDEPFFEQRQGVKSPQNVSALIGKTAFLSCIVRNLGKAKSVSSILK